MPMHKVSCFLAAIFLAGTASGQTLRYQVGPMTTATDHAEASTIHLTQLLTNSPSGQQALAKYQEMKASGELAARKNAGTDAVGSVLGFQVFNYERAAYDELEFTLKVETDRFNIWVETAEITSGRINDETIEALRVALQDETPAASFDPTKGVLALDELVFGNPTDVDNSGKSDVLVLDIRDGYDPAVGGSSVQGFVDPNNLSGLNFRDILHLDTFPSLAAGANVNGLYLTAAHEYQHLIRFAYDPGELTFVDEGLSEWAEVMTGYGPRRNTYWADTAELRRPLLGWRGTLEPGVDFDYQRAGLLTNYLAERIGVLPMGAITRASARGAAGYDVALSAEGLAFEDVLADFHVASAVNDAGVDPIYSHGSWFTTVRAANAFEYDGASQSEANVTADGNTGNPSPLEPGSVTYHQWNDVADFSMEMDALAGSGPVESMRARLRAFLVLNPASGSKSVLPISLGGEPISVSGAYRDITLVVAHVDASLPGGFNSSWAPFAYTSSWTPGSIGSNTTSVTYDDGNVVVISDSGGQTTLDAWPFSDGTLGEDALVANSFEIPPGGVLTEVEVANFYASYFDGSLPADPRDYTLRVHEVDPLSGEPGNVVLELERDDDAAPPSIPGISFDTVDLSAHAGTLASLKGSLFVSVSNAGTDENTLVIPLSEFTGAPADNPSWFFTFFGSQQQWAKFDRITVSGDARFEDRVAPIRASFVTSTASEEEGVLPSEFALETNYPNPFNPTTAIAFQMPIAAQARLSVFDLLGREVAVLTDGTMPAGRHVVQFDASGFASGMYLYALDVAGQRLTRSMLLLK
ncbi:MAG: T9SS type A sorting domain-containing protein [Rhodothermales bacterium]|nr:T9SS type A sorting domain-containing protein [Rhodothermales bacterium]